MATGQVIVSSRLDGTLELLFSHPLDRNRYFLAVTTVRAVYPCYLGLLISTTVRTQTRAMIYMLLGYFVAVLLLDFGLIGRLLRMRLPAASVLLLSASNPMQAARLALLSAVEPELSTLGPVGFFLAKRLGSGVLLGLGLAWPTLFGGLCLAAAARSFRSSDLV